MVIAVPTFSFGFVRSRVMAPSGANTRVATPVCVKDLRVKTVAPSTRSKGGRNT